MWLCLLVGFYFYFLSVSLRVKVLKHWFKNKIIYTIVINKYNYSYFVTSCTVLVLFVVTTKWTQSLCSSFLILMVWCSLVLTIIIHKFIPCCNTYYFARLVSFANCWNKLIQLCCFSLHGFLWWHFHPWRCLTSSIQIVSFEGLVSCCGQWERFSLQASWLKNIA